MYKDKKYCIYCNKKKINLKKLLIKKYKIPIESSTKLGFNFKTLPPSKLY